MTEDTRTIEEIRQENAELRERLENVRLREQVAALPPTLEEMIVTMTPRVSGPFEVLPDGRIDCNYDHPSTGCCVTPPTQPSTRVWAAAPSTPSRDRRWQQGERPDLCPAGAKVNHR